TTCPSHVSSQRVVVFPLSNRSSLRLLSVELCRQLPHKTARKSRIKGKLIVLPGVFWAFMMMMMIIRVLGFYYGLAGLKLKIDYSCIVSIRKLLMGIL
ncbi:MAG: hypothetical protein WDK95_16965, partial [Syntrophorhabdaceae bacterium]